jgi:integrase
VTVGGKPQESTPKAESTRSVTLDLSLVAILRTHKARQGREKFAAGATYQDDGYLVADELGRPYRPDTVSWWFQKAQSWSGLDQPRLKLHDARHTAGSLMLARGGQVKAVSEMLGHSSPTITLSIYAHSLPVMAAEMGAALSASLLG